jgi:transposase
VLYVALELSKVTWKLGFTTGRATPVRVRDVPARDRKALLTEIALAKSRLHLPPDAPVRTCYEAGRDGFWIHRWLVAEGIENAVLEPASIEVDRRARQAKTDRLDVQRLVRLLVRHHEGEHAVRIVRVPPMQAEDERLLPRQLRRLKKTRNRLTNAIRASLFRHGLDLNPRRSGFSDDLVGARQWDGDALPRGVWQEVELLFEQFTLVERQIRTLERQQHEALEAVRRRATEGTAAQRMAVRLTELRGIGDTGAYMLATEFFGWREFRGRGQIGALAGLTGTPFCSGAEQRDQGISKAGNTWVRTLMIELSWCWLRYQPSSKLSHWFHEHVGKNGGRGKRKAIVAMARKLLVDLWHYAEHGVVPEGALLRSEANEVVA